MDFLNFIFLDFFKNFMAFFLNLIKFKNKTKIWFLHIRVDVTNNVVSAYMSTHGDMCV